jgi:putative ABC transport system permease protein
MKKKALRKDFYMEIRKSLGRFLSIFFIVAIGVAFFSGIRSTEPDMRLSGDAYFDQKNLMDIKIVSTLGLTKQDLQAVQQVDGIAKVEAGYSADVLCKVKDSQDVIHMYSILPSMNELTVEEGRMPEKADECLVDVDFLEESGYKVGDRISFTSGKKENIKETLKNDTFTIVGTASSPEYISFQRGSSTIGTGVIGGFVCVPEESFDMDVYTELYALVDGAKSLTAFTGEYEKKVEDALDNVKDIRTEREESRYREVVGEATDKLDDAKQKLEDSKTEANQKLGEVKTQLEDGRKQIENAKAEIADGYVQLETSKAQLTEKQNEVTQGYNELNAQQDMLNAKTDELNQVKDQYSALKESGLNDEQTKQMEQAMYAQITAADAQMEAALVQLDAARAQLEDGQQQIQAGWGQIEQAQSDLALGEGQLAIKEQELNEATTQYEQAKKEADDKISEGEEKIKDAQERISQIDHAKWYIFDRTNLSEYSGYGENADRMKAIGKVFPVLFFLVAALISLTTMTRMVEEQRTQIGTLKALGYSRFSIAGKYIGYACLATVGGSVLGMLIGEKTLPYIIITAYGIMYRHMNEVLIPYQLSYGLMAAIAALACTLMATVFACMKELKEQAAELMRPPTPKQGKRVFMERIPFIWKRLSFIWKATIRNLIRYKKRFFMTVFGIGGCMALLLVGFGLKDSIFDIALLQYSEIQLYDGNIILNGDASEEERADTYSQLASNESVDRTAENLLQQVEVSKGDKTKDVYLDVPKKLQNFSDFVVFKNRVTKEKYSINDSGVILTEKMAKMLDVKVGDSITISDEIKGKLEVKVVNICENYLGHYLYMSSEYYEQVYGKAPEYNSILYKMKQENKGDLEKVGESVLDTKGALSVSYTSDMRTQLMDSLDSLNIVLVVLIISAGMLAFVVLYNLNNINITERKRELATLKVLGFFDNEVSAYVYRENTILTLIGALAGIVLGKLLHQFVVVTVEIDSAMFGRNIDFSSFVYGFLITMGFSLFVNGVMYFKLKKIDMVESLKSVE